MKLKANNHHPNGNRSGSNHTDAMEFRATDSSTRKPSFTMGKRVGGSVKGRRSRPETPLLKWRLGEKTEKKEEAAAIDEDVTSEKISCSSRNIPLSARKLGAQLWRLQLTETSSSREEGERPSLQPNHVGKAHCKLHNSAMEGATKWDLINLDSSGFSSSSSVVTELKAELKQARTRIEVLETERYSSKKKLEHFLKKLSQERSEWRAKEHEKVRAYIGDIQATLRREKRNRHRLELVTSKLVNDLADSKLSVRKLVHDYEKERKARKLVEQVCDELAKDIGGDKAEFEAVKRDAIKIRDEVDDERKMLQMAEVWREERVQMKLIDAKVALEEKYSQMNKLVSQLEKFLLSPDQTKIREAESLIRSAASVNINDFSEIRYERPNPDDIFSMFEGQETVSPVMQIQESSRHYVDLNDDESGWETVSHEGCFPTVNKRSSNSNVSESVTEWDDNICFETPLFQADELSSLPSKNAMKVSPISPLNKVQQWSSPESGNRGIGCIEWPRGNAKSKLYDAKSGVHKVQLRHALRQKI